MDHDPMPDRIEFHYDRRKCLIWAAIKVLVTAVVMGITLTRPDHVWEIPLEVVELSVPAWGMALIFGVLGGLFAMADIGRARSSRPGLALTEGGIETYEIAPFRHYGPPFDPDPWFVPWSDVSAVSDWPHDILAVELREGRTPPNAGLIARVHQRLSRGPLVLSIAHGRFEHDHSVPRVVKTFAHARGVGRVALVEAPSFWTEFKGGLVAMMVMGVLAWGWGAFRTAQAREPAEAAFLQDVEMRLAADTSVLSRFDARVRRKLAALDRVEVVLASGVLPTDGSAFVDDLARSCDLTFVAPRFDTHYYMHRSLEAYQEGARLPLVDQLLDRYHFAVQAPGDFGPGADYHNTMVEAVPHGVEYHEDLGGEWFRRLDPASVLAAARASNLPGLIDAERERAKRIEEHLRVLRSYSLHAIRVVDSVKAARNEEGA